MSATEVHPTAIERAVVALWVLLADGEWRPSAEVRAELERQGINRDAGYRSARLCGVEMRPTGEPRRRSLWRIAPGTPPPDLTPKRRAQRPSPPGPLCWPDGTPCRLCGADLGGRWQRTLYCSPTCRAEAARLRVLLAGDDVGRYRSVAARLAAAASAGSALARLLAAAGLERQADGGHRP